MNALTTISRRICSDGVVCELITAAMLVMLVFSVPVLIITGMP